MPKRISSATIGMFVVGSLALMVTALVVLGSGRLFRKQHKFICFFQGSLNGLKVGAPVKVRGVQIGSVTQILLRLPPSEGKLRRQGLALTGLPVIFDVDESQLKSSGGTGEALRPRELDALIRHGLRAQLSTESFLTGLLYVDLDVHPGAPLNLQLEPSTSRYREIPTIPTNLEQLQEGAMRAIAKLQNVDFGALVQSITNTATSTNQLLSSPDLKSTLRSLKDTVANLNTTIVSVRRIVDGLDAKADPLVASLKKTSNRADLVLASLKKTSDQASLAFVQATSTLAELQMTFAPDAPLTYRLNLALDNLSGASSAVRQLADYLQRNPSALVRGKYVSESHQ